jgi:cysteine synthase/O-phosphoserine sulfhydrylase/cystathionine beta-synthase
MVITIVMYMDNMFSLLDISEVKQPVKADLKSVIPVYSKILNEGVVREPIVVEETTNVALKGYETLEALNLLSVEKVPVMKIDRSKVEVRSSHTVSPVRLEDILIAGLRGPKLPYNSFKIQIDAQIPALEVSLSDLNVRDIKRSNLRVYYDTLELLYKDWPTPLVRLRSFSSANRDVWAKLEWANPYSNSIKDRVGWSMMMAALEDGILGDIIYEATSTNTGIAITAIANLLGKRTKLFLPKTIQRASDFFLKVLGADVIRLPVGLTVEAIGEVDARSKIDGATHLNQFENDANLKVHLKYTAREIDEQLKSVGLKPDCIIGGLGTSGHMSAISIYFKSKYGSSVKVIGVQPAPNEVIPGIRRIETGMKWIHWTEFDQIVDVTRREAIEGVLAVARKEGLLIGLSAGAVFSAFNRIARDEGVYVLTFPDSGYKYSEQFEEYFRGSGEF